MSPKTVLKLAAATILLVPASGWSKVIGSFDNFDSFNDTGVTAEGFEIDIEDIKPADLTREFPSNFSATPWVNRYGIPTVKAYDYTKTAPDAEHSYDAGHKGVLVTWAATLKNGKWVAAYGSQPFGKSVAGNGTPYVANPTYTNGDSCWYYGIGNAYPSSGCDHFGISLAPGVSAGKMFYHWKVPNAANGALINGALEASIPPSPVFVVQPVVGNAAPVVNVVARAPVDANQNPELPQALEPQYGDAYWVRVTTTFTPVEAGLDALQKANVAKAKTVKTVAWKLLQRPPGVGVNAGKPERADAEVENFGKAVSVTKQYEYYKFSGVYDSETHEALCEGYYASADLANAGGQTVQIACQDANGNDAPYKQSYWTIDPGPGTALQAPTGNLGAYIGAHVNAYNVK